MQKISAFTEDLYNQKFRILCDLFPEAVTESKDDNGQLIRSINADILSREISAPVINNTKQSYSFTWPDKNLIMSQAAQPTTKTLRPIREKSSGKDSTPGNFDSENIYIEGDNLDALKILRETYLRQIKLIYIDPPYNTGHDFIYQDNFSENQSEHEQKSGQRDSEGNRLVQNKETDGKFHTNWLNMIYPRLRIARDLLSDDGVIFISIDDHEAANLRKICDEIFGEKNFRNQILLRRRVKSLNAQFANDGLKSFNIGCEYMLVYSKSSSFMFRPLRFDKDDKPEKGSWNVFWSNADRPTMRYDVLGFTPTTGQWRWQKELADEAIENYRKYEKDFADKMSLEDYWRMNDSNMRFIRRIPDATGKNGGVQCWIPPYDTTLRTSDWTDMEVSQIAKDYDLPFENPKNVNVIKEIISSIMGDDFIILDFFSGSATTADAVFRINAQDGGNRKFILVQIPEETPVNSEAFKAGYKNICEIGQERIRRAGRKIRDSLPLTTNELDTGFRVFRVDSSNIKDVYLFPEEFKQDTIELFADNIKPDRTPDDLLIHSMLRLGINLSAKIDIAFTFGKKIFIVNDNYLIACFDDNITENTVIDIAKRRPNYAVFRDSGMANDSVMTNFEQIFKTYSPDTKRSVI
ncbi:MAG: site-specific DNA-methyltransferase [Synergistaceae bacterium]|nr:site-specific DNA-methyltransferase [Synergistaceae bacterium]